MMVPEEIQAAKQACLKQSFGGALTATERELLDRFLQTAEGERYREESEEMKGMLDQVADVRVHEEVDSAAMVQGFEAMARTEIQRSKRRVPFYVACTSGVWLVTGGLTFYGGKEELRFFAWTMFVGAGLFGLLFLGLWRKASAMLEDGDFVGRLEREREYSKSPRVVVTSLLVAGVFFGVLGYGIGKGTGKLGVVIWGFCTVIAIAVAVVRQEREKRKNRELWDWWEGS